MSAITDLIGKAKGKPAILAGTIIGLLALVLVIGMIGGAILIFGLNLMGFEIPYTMGTMLGGAIVISCLRSIGSYSK
jgi:predicted PurR-regulated permease PerM